MTELRWNPLRQEWVATATARQQRTFLPPRDRCPLDPSPPNGPLTEAPRPYEIAILQNRFPSFMPDPPAPAVAGSAISPVRPSRGVCEVVLYTPRHDASIGVLDAGHLERLVSVWTDRYRVLGALDYVDYVYIFENRGEAVGVTLNHPHGQIYAYPFIPPVPALELDSGARHRAATGRCLLCDIVDEEQRGPRVVAENERFLTFCPFGARYPYEAHIAAKRHIGSLARFDAADRPAFARALGGLVRAYDGLFGFPLPYIMAMHQRPSDGAPHEDAHFHVEFYPLNRTKDKLKYLAGSEAGAGAFVTDLLPEQTAESLRSTWQSGWPPG